MPPKPRHAKLSPSAAHRWLECPASIKACEGIPEEPSSSYADEGTAAHELAEACLRYGVDAAALAGMPTTVGVDTSAMAPDVQLYLNAVREAVAGSNALHTEVRVSVGAVHEDCNGTADAIVVAIPTRTLWVFDLKFGAGIRVSVVDNPQTMIYALGAYYAMDEAARVNIATIRMVIVQPRRANGDDDRVRFQDIMVQDLFAWQDTVLAPGVARTQSERPEYCPSAAACKWCPASKTCEALRDRGHAAAAEVFALPMVQGVQQGTEGVNPETLGLGKLASAMSPERLGEALRLAPILEQWLSVIRKHAEARLHHGDTVPGFKLVQGKPKNRAWTGTMQEVAGQLHALGLSPEEIYATPKPITPAAAEKLLPKDKKPSIGGMTSRADGAIVMAPSSDPRTPVRANPAAVFGVETPGK